MEHHKGNNNEPMFSLCHLFVVAVFFSLPRIFSHKNIRVNSVLYKQNWKIIPFILCTNGKTNSNLFGSYYKDDSLKVLSHRLPIHRGWMLATATTLEINLPALKSIQSGLS